jgi:hypothetical protein
LCSETISLMKKLIPVLIALAVLIAAGAYLIVARNRNIEEDGEERAVAFKDRPVVALVPRADGYWLDMSIEKFRVKGTTSVEYLLVYTIVDDEGTRQQGVPGTLEINGQDKLTAELLLGSESRGVYRYDEGVEGGTLTLRFKNKDDKTLARFESGFRMYTQTDTLTSSDGKFTLELDEESELFFVVIDSIGVPGEDSDEPAAGPYGLYSSNTDSFTGQATVSAGSLKYWDGGWVEASSPFSSGIYSGY